MHLGRKITRFLFWLIVALLGLVVLVFLLIQLPVVQQRITSEVQNIARSTLKTDVGIGNLSIAFPRRIDIDDVYLNHPDGDTIAKVGHLGVRMDMFALIRSTVSISSIEIDDIYAKVITTDSSSNIQFLLEAFLPGVDTLALKDSPQADSVADSSGGFLIDLAGAELSLNNADIYYQDDPAGIRADVVTASLAARIDKADLEAMSFEIDYIDLKGAKLAIGIGESSIPVDTTVQAAPIALSAGRVTISESALSLAMDSLDIVTELPYLNLEGTELTVGDSIAFNGDLFQLRDFAFSMDTPLPALDGPGIDYNHLALTAVEAEATDIAYIVDSLHLRLRQLSATERSGFVLEKTEGTVIYNPSFIGLQDFLLRTGNSELKSEHTAINYDFASADLEQMVASAQLDGFLGLKDVALIAPDVAKGPLFSGGYADKIDFSLRADGTVADMEIGRIEIDGPGIKVRASGQAFNLLDPDKLGGRLRLREFSLTPGPLLPLLPAGTLPAGIDLPTRIVAEGTASYGNDRLELDLYALENRVFGNGLNSRVRTSGVINGVSSFPSTRLNVDLDTLIATRATILAYVPPGTLPEDYTIPDFIRGSGSVSGPMDNLDLNLQLGLPGDSTYARINGNVRNALDVERLALDLEISDLAVNIGDITTILPDSTLPANLKVPNLRIRNGSIRGSLTDMIFDVPIETDNGLWKLNGRYNPEDLNIRADLTGVNVADLFVGPLHDTLQQMDIGPLNLRAKISGKIEPVMLLSLTTFVEQTNGDSLLDLTALVSGNRYSARFATLHPDFLSDGSGRYILNEDSTVFAEAMLNIQSVQLETWGVTSQPLEVAGKMVARTEGIDPYALDAFVRLDDIILRGKEGSSFVDSLLLTAAMHDWDNKIYLRSDVVDGDIVGRFDPLKTPEKMVRFLTAYIDENMEQPDPVEDGDEIDMTFKLKRPQPLTGGLIDGLTDLSPMSMSLLYRDASPEFLFSLDLPELVYSGLETRDLKLRIIGDTVNLMLNADWADVSYNDQIELGRTVISSETIDNELLVELKLYTPEDSLRHYLGLLVDQAGDSLTVKLEEEQILNFETWTVPITNLITLAGPNLLIRDFALRNGRQSLSAETIEPNNVAIAFNEFDLRTPSRLLFSEEEVAAGIVNGSVNLDDVMASLGIRADLTVDSLAWTNTLLGNLSARVETTEDKAYDLNINLTEAGNDASVTGTYAADGTMDLLVDLERLQLRSAEPFSLGYLEETEGFLNGQLAITGDIESPSLNGSFSFRDASLVISLLGERFRMGTNPITFSGQRIAFTDGLKIFDSFDKYATLTGGLTLDGFDDIRLDMLVEAENFTAINSTEDDNPDYYGKMSVDARVEIEGTATLPIINVDATTNDGSEITYVYTAVSQGIVGTDGVVMFEEQYEWNDIIRRDTALSDSSLVVARTGVEMTINLDIQPNLKVTVVVDPISGQTFVGRADGNLTLKIAPDGSQEATGRVEIVQGTYDFVYQVINKEFEIVEGSNVVFNGEIENPVLDLTIRHKVRTSALPLVEGTLGPGVGDAGTLRRKQTFYVIIGLKGDLQASDLTTDVLYPEDAYGNLGISNIDDALGTLRQDNSRMTTNAFQLLAFGSFNIPIVDQGGGDGTSLANTTLNNALGGYLNNLANQYVGFVDIDFGLDSYQDSDGTTNTNLRVSLRKTLFDDRVVVSVDGVAGNDADDANGTSQTYLDNITAEYLINEDGTFRLKFFNDRDRDVLIGGNVLRYGGRLTFSKDFDSLGWSRNKNQR